MDKIRLNKYIALSGVCSRREADKLITEGKVTINDNVVTELGICIDSDRDEVKINGTVIDIVEEKIYIMLNKPRGYVTTAKEQFKRPCVLDIVREEGRIYPVGRLDMDSEGLLLLTNDGDFTNNIIHPSRHICKKYEVKLSKEISQNDLHELERGIDIGGYVTAPALTDRIDDNSFTIIIKEGKNRQIRRMCETLGNKVIRLKRIAIGRLELGNLNVGEYKLLKKKDIEKIFEI